mmetsp:Transcript_31103/g.68744  ORF Transcript_31103/g.68744 Transcript_31103/m.68744 type:complete len:83 (-) Transcript_31103:540-788(-)
MHKGAWSLKSSSQNLAQSATVAKTSMFPMTPQALKPFVTSCRRVMEGADAATTGRMPNRSYRRNNAMWLLYTDPVGFNKVSS